jgi:alkanesulfonate monooxygenase SsuD/methylene tetrahydromethanopterin reductase-like flavin-dependent oxidoreductase (luciferase family)
MGSKKTNFYHRIASGMGYEQEADEVQRLFLSRDYAGAAAAVPFEFLDRTCLLGDVDRIADRIARLAEGGVTSVNISCFDSTLDNRIGTLRTVVQAAEKAGVTA